ncbi:MAG: hypothetical protein KAJ06_09420 [Gammaproteobacteria bacterium]|nr:hypothetical protein [Gammaproteobacteria bacterium]
MNRERLSYPDVIPDIERQVAYNHPSPDQFSLKLPAHPAYQRTSHLNNMEPQLPKRKKPGKKDFDTNPEAVRQWVNDLPLINTDKARELLDQALEQINTLEINPLDRYKALELFSTPVLSVTEALKSEFTGRQVPLLGEYLASAEHCLKLYDRMATGYEIMAADLGRMTGMQPRLATAIHRALRYSSEALLANYQIYRQYPEGLWKCIHTLYTAAEKEGVTSKIIFDTTLPSSSESTIETVYKQILLLSLACPYRLRQKEILYVYDALLEWAVASRLSSGTDKQDSGLFATNLLSDDPPAYRALNSNGHMHGYWRVLDTSKMASILRKAVTKDALTTGVHAGIGDKDTLQRLMLAWGVMPKRRFTRHQANMPVKLVVGLDSIHQLAEGPAVETMSEQQPTAEEIRDRQYLQDPTFEKTTSFRTGPAIDINADWTGRDNSRHGTVSANAAAASQFEAWKIADMSAGGYCLLWDSTESTSAMVGGLVAVMITDNAGIQDWHLGVIRRIRFTKERGLELGIQMLSPGARSAWTCICRNDIRTTSRMKSILLPEIKSIGQEASLLLPSLPFRVGCISTLEYDGHKETIVLTRLLENTGIFGQYHFMPAEGL